MEVRGRPTPQPPRTEHPRFLDRTEENPRSDINPFIFEHTQHKPILLTADDAWRFRGRWADAFGGRDAPLHVEIGSGNGFFLSEFARRNPALNVLGIEIRYKRTVLCARKIAKVGAQANARIARYHAAFLDDLFLPGQLAGIWVHHPDPWPKGRHEKNRLISRWFLEDVATYLEPGGRFRLKSDFRPNIERVEELLADPDTPALPLEISGRSDDVTAGNAPWPDDIETNYQSKFRRRGLPVYAVELTRRA
ncbi:MAG: tRNA (guanine-N7-)-methyltransferase [Myxococcota bacterium]|jgi:tRNA (guanine-N7-)-methyltransferase